MKKAFVKFVRGKKDEKKESGGITPSQSGDLVSPARTPDDEGYLGLDNSSGYVVDFSGRDKTLTKLHKAAWQGNLEKLKSALKKVEIDAVDKRNRTALHFAVAQGHPNIVWFLLGSNANTSVCDDEGFTPLLKAIECGHKECMNLLLDRSAEVNVSDYTGNTGLHIAVSQASLDTVSALLKKGADTEISNNAGDYPLHIATKLENKDLVDLLLGAGASVDVLDRENRTPLMLAAKTGNSLLARLFVEKGAQSTVVDSNGWSAQDYAMLGGHESVAVSLKSFSDGDVLITTNSEKSSCNKIKDSTLVLNNNSGSWEESQTEESEKKPIIQKLKTFFERHPEGEEHYKPMENNNNNNNNNNSNNNYNYNNNKNNNEDSVESPDSEAIPPFCQPPRSWEIIQAGMIDEKKNGDEPKRRSLTILGNLHFRRESFTEGSASSPEFTLSLNRRKGAKANNAFAKQRFSFSEEESLRCWMNDGKIIRGEFERTELKSRMNFNGPKIPGERHAVAENDSDSISAENSRTDFTESHVISRKDSESGTLGRKETMRESEEVWVANPHLSPARTGIGQQRSSWDSEDTVSEKEGIFPPPPSALELGVDMAKSIKCMKGMSIDQPPEPSLNRNLWKNFYDSHSLDCLEERGFSETSKGKDIRAHGKHRSGSVRKGAEIFKCQKPKDRLADVSRKINEQLECYDQALRELAESSKNLDKAPHQKYYSLPNARSGGGGDEYEKSTSRDLTSSSPFAANSSHSLPFFLGQPDVDNNEKLGSERPIGASSDKVCAGKSEKKTKRHMLLAMRDVRHAVHVANTFRTSMDDQILSPLTKPEDSFDLIGEPSPKGISNNSEGSSPPDENPFFGMGRQQTVLEKTEKRRKSSSSSTGEESTLWLQEDKERRKEAQSPRSEDDISEIAPDESSKHKRLSSFSPLGVIQREMEEEESRTKKFSSLDVSASGKVSEELFCGENEEHYREQSPDVSLSSGPIEPIGVEKDSGSEPESSHNDASPPNKYALKNQHVWLKSHLKAATSEKNKLEELTAQLSEKMERLQYELADAREATKSKDEVIQLLQGQLARMEAAYTKSLEESVQNRLQLTSHEQEILHLKELCYKYEEEKEAAVTGIGGEFFQELQLKIKTLEEEKEKMNNKIICLEEEKTTLEKRLKKEKKEESEMMDQCQQWKERYGKLEEMAKAYDSKQAAYESYVKEKDREFVEQKNRLQHLNFQLEKKYLELNEENIDLKAKLNSLAAELEAEKRRASTSDEKYEFICELKRKNNELEAHLKKLEKEMEDKMVKKLKEKEEEVGGLVKQFNRERDSLIASYEKKLIEGKSEQSLLAVGEWKKENQRLRQMVKRLQYQIDSMQKTVSTEIGQISSKNENHRGEDGWGLTSVPVGEVQKDLRTLNDLVIENLNLKREINNLAGKIKIEGAERIERIREEDTKENAEVKSEILELKTQVNSIRKLVDGERWFSTDGEHEKNPEKKLNQKSDGKKKWIGKEDELAWSSLYGMKAAGRKRGGRSTSVTETLITVESGKNENKNSKSSHENILSRINATSELETEIVQKSEKLEFLQLKKEILSLQSKMSDEKNIRHALENQIIKMNLDLKERENLEKEMNSLKAKVDRDCLKRSEMELLEYQKDLDVKMNNYLGEKKEEPENIDFKAKCEIYAKEREKTKELRNLFGRKAKSFDSQGPEAFSQLKLNPRPHSDFFLHPRLLTLDIDMKNKLEIELNKSIKKHAGESSSAPSISNLHLVNKNYF